jgi:ribosome-associated toxin RatA of RatAB toxin-antitoxin module
MSFTKIESEKVAINNSAEKIFNNLSDFRNFEKLMPAQVSEWTATADECSFNINGMATIGMKIIEKTPFSKIIITSNGKVPFDFKLLVDIVEQGAENAVGQITFESDLNPMMKMMVEKPLGNFFNMLAKKMADIK